MRYINLYDRQGLNTLSLSFNDPIVEYQEKYHWAVIRTPDRTFTINGTAFLGYDDRIAHAPIFSEISDFWKTQLNEKYKANDKILIVFSENEVPIMFFSGKAISLVVKNDVFAEFVIDGNTIWLYHMHFLILSKNK